MCWCFLCVGALILLLGSNIRVRAICSAEVMDNTEVDFIGKMILDEVMELFATVLPPAETKETMKGFISSSKDLLQIEGTYLAAAMDPLPSVKPPQQAYVFKTLLATLL